MSESEVQVTPAWDGLQRFSRRDDSAHLQGVIPEVAARSLASQTELAAEDARLLPTVIDRGGDVAALAMIQNLEDDLVAAGIYQPVLGDAGAMVGIAQPLCVLLLGAVADHLQHPVRRPF